MCNDRSASTRINFASGIADVTTQLTPLFRRKTLRPLLVTRIIALRRRIGAATLVTLGAPILTIAYLIGFALAPCGMRQRRRQRECQHQHGQQRRNASYRPFGEHHHASLPPTHCRFRKKHCAPLAVKLEQPYVIRLSAELAVNAILRSIRAFSGSCKYLFRSLPGGRRAKTIAQSGAAGRFGEGVCRESSYLPVIGNIPLAILSGYDSPMTERKILVVDDDKRLRDLLQRYLGEQGFVVRSAENAEMMDRLLNRDTFDLIVLDLMLPGEDGLAICRRLRGAGNDVAIIMLTAKGDDVDRIIGLEIGADDYLPKPFNPRELVARIQAVLRRRVTVIPGAPTAEDKIVTFGNIEVDLAIRSLKRDGETQSLTTGEFAVLKVMLEHPRQPLSRDRLMTLARGREQGPFDRAIDVQMSRLRKLIESDPATPRYLQTVWGFGYVFVPDGQAK